MEKSTPTRTLEITVISGENLRLNHKRPIKKNAFVIVRSDSDNQTTKMNEEGRSRTSWNEKMEFKMPINALFITVEVHCKTSFGNRVVGTAKVPVSDFVGGYTPPSYLHFLSYRLREENGERNGIINLSVRVKGSPEFPAVGSAVSRPPLMGTPVGWRKGCGEVSQRPWLGTPVNGRDSGGVVTGLPIWYNTTYPV